MQTRLATLKADMAERGFTRWPAVQSILRKLNAARKLHLFREDNNARLTPADEAARVLIGGEPRHIAQVGKLKGWRTKSTTPVQIEYGAEMNSNVDAGGWVPQLWVDGSPKLPAGRPKGYELERAMLHSEMEAHNEAKEWAGDYSPTVTKRFPESRPTLKPNPEPQARKAPKAARAPRAPKTPKAQEARVLRAYDELKAETGLRNVRVASLAARSNLKPAALHAVLTRLHKRDMVNPAYGEPNAVDAAERAAAWELGGERFMLVEIDRDGFDAMGLREREEAKHLIPDQQTIIDAHNRLDRQGYNVTLLFDLRRETRLSRGRFNAAIQALRKDRRAYLESSQGQAVKLTDAQRAAGIQEDGRNLVYFSLNDGWPAIKGR